MSKESMDKPDETAESAAAPGCALIDLTHGLEIKHVEEASVAMGAALDQGLPLTIDLKSIPAIDTAGVQLLLALQIEATKRGTPLNFTGESAVLTQALTVLGLRDRFNPSVSRG
jgi:anti-anti-sigma regulatory factor